MLKITNLYKSYHSATQTVEVLTGINLNIEEGELVSIMGPSGSGKSTLLNVLGMLDNYDSGDYFLDNNLTLNQGVI